MTQRNGPAAMLWIRPKVKHDPQKEQDFMMLRRYCIVNRRKMSELTADDFRKAGITGKS